MRHTFGRDIRVEVVRTASDGVIVPTDYAQEQDGAHTLRLLRSFEGFVVVIDKRLECEFGRIDVSNWGGMLRGGVALCITPNRDRMPELAYRVIFEPDPDGSAYNAIIPAFPHAHTFGATVEEAMANAREIIELELDVARERGDEMPASDVEHFVVGTITVTAASPRQ